MYVKAASGRQRLNVSGAWNAATRERIRITNTTVVNTQTMGELLRAIAARQLVGPVTLVLDNARYQRNKVVQALAKELGIELLFLPPVLAKPEPDRAAMEVCQEAGAQREILRKLRDVQDGDRRLYCRSTDEVQARTRFPADAAVPDVRESSVTGRVEYNPKSDGAICILLPEKRAPPSQVDG